MGEVLVCVQASGGMCHTLAEGVAQLPPWAGVLVALADMPGIRMDTFCRAAAALTPEHIVVPEFQGCPGHPVGFRSDWFGWLLRLTGDAGAGALHRLQAPVRRCYSTRLCIRHRDIHDDQY